MIARLAWTVARPSRAGLGLTLLPIVAFAVTTALLLIVVGAARNFWEPVDDLDVLYEFLATVALSLLVVPLAGLGGAAARLSARRRDDRLAALRLLGATSGTVAAIAILESAVLALIGAVAGIGLAAAVAPVIGALSFRGRTLGVADALTPPALTAVVVAGVLALAVSSAVLGLRGVVLSPLGVRRRTDAPRTRALPVILGVVGVAILAIAMKALGAAGSAVALLVIVAVVSAGGLALLNLIGPAALGLWARVRARRARTATQLLAARGILESPRAMWRQVGGTASVAFTAVFAGAGAALIGAAGGTGNRAQDALLQDIRTGLVATIVCAFAMVACSVGVTQAAAILDDAPRTLALSRLGLPIGMLDAVRRRTVLGPLLATSIGSAVCAAVVLFPLVGLGLILAPLSMLVILGALAAGVGLVALVLLLTRSLLRRVAAEPA